MSFFQTHFQNSSSFQAVDSVENDSHLYLLLLLATIVVVVIHYLYHHHHHLQQTSESKSAKRKESMSAVESDDTPASSVASSIFESVVFSGNIVKSIHTGEEEELPAPAAAPSEASAVPNHTSSYSELCCCATVLNLQLRW
jgi:hypothetical protein